MSLIKWPDCNRRIVRVLALWIGFPLLGVCYGMLVRRGDLSGAFYENPVVLMLLPIGLILAIRLTYRYLRTGSKCLTRWENRVVIGMIVLLIGFGIARNLKYYA